jgi:hypothetical protein
LLRDGPLELSRSNGPRTIATGTAGALTHRGLAKFVEWVTKVEITEAGLRALKAIDAELEHAPS